MDPLATGIEPGQQEIRCTVALKCREVRQGKADRLQLRYHSKRYLESIELDQVTVSIHNIA